jgi:two-component system, NtrC family, sensor kinase
VEPAADLSRLARLVGDLVGLEVSRGELAARLSAGLAGAFSCDRIVLRLQQGPWWHSWTWRAGAGCGPARRGGRPPVATGPRVIERRLRVAEGGRISFHRRSTAFTGPERVHASALAETAGLVLRGYTVRASLRERVKELGCLYAISQAAHRHAAAEDGMLRDIAAIIPDGFQFPRRAAARLSVDGRTWRTPRRAGGKRRLDAPIAVHGARRGELEVSYPAGVAGPGEDPFLPDERKLVDEIALQVGLALERSRDAEERGRLEGQLRHADRLATLGELAAGVAHEINEPLEGILGFAQLARRASGSPAAAEPDLDRVISEALRARDIVRRLLLFARQAPSHRGPVELNAVVRGIEAFLEQRCRAAGVDLAISLGRGAGTLTGDGTQLSQVVVNLAVNAIQAMPGGGRLAVATRGTRGAAVLAVEDTGTGMGPDVLARIFVPFFTTKPVGAGTGLGLPVVHGIVTAHGGTIAVDSAPGHGSRFTVTLPRNRRGEGHGDAGGC